MTAPSTCPLGYPLAEQHYFSGFAADASDWSAIVTAAREAVRDGIAETFIWAMPQIVRDGLTIIGLIGFLFYSNWRFALTNALVVCGVLAVFAWMLQR